MLCWLLFGFILSVMEPWRDFGAGFRVLICFLEDELFLRMTDSYFYCSLAMLIFLVLALMEVVGS